jgi:hypothetical protein
MNKYEIRKYVEAPNIVEAFNMDVQTPPEYIVMVEQGEVEEDKQFGFTCTETDGSKGSKKTVRKSRRTSK